MKAISLKLTRFLIFTSLLFGNAHAAELVGYWNFEESSGTTAQDQSAYGNDGTLTGALRTTGIKGQGLIMDGTGGVTIPQSASINAFADGFSMDAWIKPTAWGDYPTIFYKTNAVTREFLHFQASPTGQLHIGMNTDPHTWTTPDPEIILNKWQHVAWTYDEAYQRLYVDGSEVWNTPFTDEFTSNTEPLYLGENPYVSASNFTGLFDEARLYSGALTPTEILANMNSVVPEPATAALFLLGGGALIMKRLKRKKHA